ncbi:ABC transporter ATP-binding protein [Sporosarcina sp. SAFN-015]|uniref:ABC transporter ATP-binding protein n=1 Tax=Sporosarcina sp. SAFN-015 TaxID=3387274 RepID=UPI003F7EF46A
MPILEVENLSTEFNIQNGVVKAVRGISFHVDKGETIGIVGESGSGKSVSMLSIMGLLADSGRVVDGKIRFDGKNISSSNCNTKKKRKDYEKKMQSIRCNEISMIFQDPMTYLNPLLRIDTQIVEPIKLHLKLSHKDAIQKAVSLLELVGIPSPEERLKQYPHELSGGMRQRIIIAIALSCNPKLIIADEPTTALDVTIQAQVLDLIKDLKAKLNTSVIMITHDLGVVASMCTRIMIMYGGQIVEQGTDREIFYSPKHPYTKGLLNSINNPTDTKKKKLIPIPGSPPDLLKPPIGCPFVDRCTEAMYICKSHPPRVEAFSDTHQIACWLHHPMSNKGGESLV